MIVNRDESNRGGEDSAELTQQPRQDAFNTKKKKTQYMHAAKRELNAGS